MRAWKKIIWIVACCITINALGQTNGGQSMDIQQRVDYINQHVTNLTPDQQSKIRTIEEYYLSTIKRVRPEAIDSLRHVTDNNIRMVLSNEQLEQYQNLAMYPH